ncbi:AAA family ATPase [Candidatus Woesearchaeota archaeon]|nr:AAA family ATPase [Candidatus Woesearchaeota archaeon]
MFVFLKKNKKNILYFSCEPLTTKNDIIRVIEEFDRLFLNNGYKYVFFDEISYIDEWELAKKNLLETKLFLLKPMKSMSDGYLVI